MSTDQCRLTALEQRLGVLERLFGTVVEILTDEIVVLVGVGRSLDKLYEVDSEIKRIK